MSTLRERAEDAETTIRCAAASMFSMAVHATLDQRQYTERYGRFDWQATHCEGGVSAYVSSLHFLTGEKQDAIRDRIEKAADEQQAKQGRPS